jgi:hypothetical protein
MVASGPRLGATTRNHSRKKGSAMRYSALGTGFLERNLAGREPHPDQSVERAGQRRGRAPHASGDCGSRTHRARMLVVAAPW